MKRKFYAGGILLLTIIIISFVFILFNNKLEVNASTTVFVNQPYNVHFSHSITSKSIDNEMIYLTNANGEKVNASMKLQQNKQSLSIENLPTGEYVLHVEKKAFEKASITTDKQTIEFKVIEKLEKLTSVQQLEDFFQTVLNQEKQIAKDSITTVEESAEMAKSDKASSNQEASYSTTNNQVKEIEEGDIVVTDGKFIYSIIDNQIVITDASNPKSMQVASKITLDVNSYPSQLMIHDNMLIVILDEYVEMKENDYVSGNSMTTVAFYNVKDAKNPKLIREVSQDGYMNGIRKYNDVLYIVTNKTPNYWLLREGEDVELRPYMYDSSKSDEMEPMDIDKLTILPGTSEPNYTVISAIDLNNFENEEIETKGYLGGSSTLYMSKNALYLTGLDYLPIAFTEEKVATSKVTDMAIMPVATSTDIYKFAINGTKIDFVASTSITGNILNQFSMDEHDGYFRIATTEGNTWGGTNETSKNHLFIYDEQLKKVGEVTDLAPGERIYSARFMGDKAYVVTFKQVDPLFVIDLQNPEQPKVLGELKIPGFSNYLHPLDENHLIGIGYDTETKVDSYSKQPFTTTTGIKVSLFDITDYSNPKEQDTVVIGGRGTYSEVEHNHKVLFRNEQYNYFGFPVSIYEPKGEYEVKYKGAGALVYEITAENGIQLKGDLVTPAKEGEEYENWEAMITRLLYIDDALYTVSRNEVKSYNLQNFNSIGRVKLK